MKSSVYNILKARFLVNEDANKNWRFIIYVVVLVIIMIGNTNSYEQKVFKIKDLEDEVKELRSEFADRRKELMDLKLESTVETKMIESGVKPSEKPPVKIKVTKQEEEKSLLKKIW
jgi:hypothetical protein